MNWVTYLHEVFTLIHPIWIQKLRTVISPTALLIQLPLKEVDNSNHVCSVQFSYHDTQSFSLNWHVHKNSMLEKQT